MATAMSQSYGNHGHNNTTMKMNYNDSGSYSHSPAGSNTLISNAAVESAVDAYASRILRMRSPPEACIDSSVGPYVTSILRCAIAPAESSPNDAAVMDNVESLAEYDSLVELLEEHCNMTPEVARGALQCIAVAVRTGKVDVLHDDPACQHRRSSRKNSLVSLGGMFGRYRSKSMGEEHDYNDVDSIRLLGDMLRNSDIANHTSPTASSSLFPFLNPGMDGGSPHGTDSIEEEPSFYFEEDEVPETPVHKNRIKMHPSPDVSDNSSNAEDHNALCKVAPVPINTYSVTPLKPDRLIPVDLLGVIDDPSTPACEKNQASNDKPLAYKLATSHYSSPIPTPSSQTHPVQTIDSADRSVVPNSPQALVSLTRKGKKKVKSKDTDLAAALFCSSRPRSNSLQNDRSPKLKPMTAPPASVLGLPGLSLSSSSAITSNSIPVLFQKQLESAVQILLSMNFDLCEDAAQEAALVSNADVNLAQHVIDGATSAPPVCRHMLNNACYRSDCQFSHDVDGHTCLFWLRGRCGKGGNCRFMHGFSEKLLEGIKEDYLPDHRRRTQKSPEPTSQPSLAASPTGTKSIPIKTTNLVLHNMKTSFSAPIREGSHSSFPSSSLEHTSVPSGTSFEPSSPFTSATLLPPQNSNNSLPTPHSKFESIANSSEECNEPPKPVSVTPTPDDPQSKPSPTFSFASIATKGYSKRSSFSDSSGLNGGIGNALASSNGNTTLKTVKIPQNLWNASHNRSSSAFHIADPMTRYREVSASVSRDDVIDLHFQSIKSFPIVLSTILPEKFRDHGEVWVVTGSGHHVSRNTHQKGGGVLESAVPGWLVSHGYDYLKGKDKNGYGGAFLVKKR